MILIFSPVTTKVCEIYLRILTRYLNAIDQLGAHKAPCRVSDPNQDSPKITQTLPLVVESIYTRFSEQNKRFV